MSPAAHVRPATACRSVPPSLLSTMRTCSNVWCSMWDDGTANPEPCLDQFTLVGKYEALKWLAGGMGIFAALGTACVWSAPEKRVPWVSGALGCTAALIRRWQCKCIET